MQERNGMEAPGLSLFQGANSIHINASTQRQEEEEEQEDRMRRREEINDLLTNAFDDLVEEDDDVSSVNSSNYHDASKAPCDNSSIINKSSTTQADNDRGPTVSQYQNEFDIYGQSQSTSFPLSDIDKAPTSSELQHEFGIYGQIATPYNNNKENNTLNSLSESHYALPRPPSLTSAPMFPPDLRAQINDGYTLLENYPTNYETPSNHYDNHRKNYPKNGYIEMYGSNIPQKESGEYDGNSSNIGTDRYNHCLLNTSNGRKINDENAYKIAEYNSKEQLEVLYSVRMREINQLTEELQQLHSEKDEERNQLTRKLALAQAEIERSNLSRNQAQNALVDAKAEIAELQSQASAFKEKIAVVEKTNKNMAEELSVARNSVVDLQQKIEVLERVQSLQANDKTHEKFLKQAQDKHAIEMKNMQTQINILTDKLNAKESSYTALEYKLADVRRSHEALIVEKGDTMNRLAQALEESQTQCRNLMATNNAQENMQLQNKVKLLIQEKEELGKKIQELQHQLEVAKVDNLSYDALLANTMEEESDSIRQMKLGELYNKSRGNCEDMTNKLRGELQRCIAGQTVKRKEISRLENTLAQKDRELKKAQEIAGIGQQEAARYAKLVNQLELELKAVMNEENAKTTIQIQRLLDELNAVRTQYEALRREKHSLEKKLEETIAEHEETIRKIQQDTIAEQEKEIIEEYNKEYLEIHDKAVERVRQEAQNEIVQLTVQLEQTQKELDRVKELYIDVCKTKEQLIYDHKNEIKTLKETYVNLESQITEMDQLKNELEKKSKIVSKLNYECESLKKTAIELEKDLDHERKKKTEYSKKIHEEIEKAKEEALAELRNSHPDQQISFFLPDYCTEHSDKITQLEADCKRLEDKLSTAVEDQRKMFDLQTELDNAKIKLAQMEITHETLKKKYEKMRTDRNELVGKLMRSEHEFSQLKKNCSQTEKADDTNIPHRVHLENETLKMKCDNLLKEIMEYKKNIADLQDELTERKKNIIQLESKLGRLNETSRSQNDLEKELNHYKEIVKKMSEQICNNSDSRKNDLYQEERLKISELELREKEVQLQRLTDLEKIKEERDQLVTKLKNQAKQFEQYVKSQKQVQAELNLSPRSAIEGVDFQKLREMSTKEVREEMEQKVAEELRIIEDRHREKQKSIEEKYKSVLAELNARYSERTREVIHAERIKLHSSYKEQEQMFAQIFEVKLEEYKRELTARKHRIDELQVSLKQKENEIEEDKNNMAQVMSDWVAEIQAMKFKEEKMQGRINELKEIEDRLNYEITKLKDEAAEMTDNIDTLKRKHQSAKIKAQKYKEYAEEKEKFLMGDCRRIEEGYKKALKQVNEKLNEMVDMQEKEVNEKFIQMQNKYEEQKQKLRQKLKYKDKS